MKNYLQFHVKKRTLLAIAGIVWIIAGINVSRVGIIAYLLMGKISIHPFLSLLVFAVFGAMFFQMSKKHLSRIRLYKERTRPFWHFFDLKSYLIMVFMMSLGIWLRSSSLVSSEFIAVFYTGLGFALILAGISFWGMYFKYPTI
ncbi:hypothetical protein HMPREF1987_01047 [Peptostreptococcaceae bacterium oral taxon 113 str. W5053]|nr:hypothetical protein HMPREF1987_01047 [Peptostreptococcaceae bacterium oral taxon 113 str. W5053]